MRVFSPLIVLAQLYLRLRIDRDFQRFRVGLRFSTHRFDILKDRIGVFRFLQRLSFLNSFQSIVHPIQNVSHRAFAVNYGFRVTAIQQRLSHLRRREVRVTSFGLEFRVGVRMRFDDQMNVDGQLWILNFAAFLSSVSALAGRQLIGIELSFREAFRDRVPSPTESIFSLPRIAIAKL